MCEMLSDRSRAITNREVTALALPKPDPSLRQEIGIWSELAVRLPIRTVDAADVTQVEAPHLQELERRQALGGFVSGTDAELQGMTVGVALPHWAVDVLLQHAEEQHEKLAGGEVCDVPRKATAEQGEMP
jgi:hypothetical protein